jgi:hypothetical protein
VLGDDEIRTSYRLPASGTGPAVGSAKTRAEADLEVEAKAAVDEENDLRRILAGVEVLLRDGYRLVADRSLERRMTQQRAQTLSDFAHGVGKKGRDRAFRSLKNESTLTTYFRKMKELFTYYNLVV